MGKRLRDCSDASHEKGVREGRGQIDRLLAHAHTSSTSLPQSLRIWQLGVLQRSSLSENLVKMTDRNAIVTDWCLLAGGPVNSRFCLSH